MGTLTFLDEIDAFLLQGFEQQPAVQKAIREGVWGEASPQEAYNFMGAMVAKQGAAIRKIAAEIDKLRDAVGDG